jgi:hypothetical protein
VKRINMRASNRASARPGASHVFGKFVRDDVPRWRKLIADANITSE